MYIYREKITDCEKENQTIITIQLSERYIWDKLSL